MKTETYPKIGSKVSYVRQAPTESGYEFGEAVIHAIALDPDKRLMAHLRKPSSDPNNKVGYDAFNVQFPCLNPSQEFIDNFSAKIAEIEAIGKEGNEKIKALTDDYNGRVKAVQDTVLGNSIELESDA